VPLVLRAAGTEHLARGSRVRVRIADIDLLTLDAHAVLLERLGDDDVQRAPMHADDAPPPDVEDDADGDGDGSAPDAGALSLAIEVDDAHPAAPSAAPAG
jgi:exoribonuclease-2